MLAFQDFAASEKKGGEERKGSMNPNSPKRRGKLKEREEKKATTSMTPEEREGGEKESNTAWGNREGLSGNRKGGGRKKIDGSFFFSGEKKWRGGEKRERSRMYILLSGARGFPSGKKKTVGFIEICVNTFLLQGKREKRGHSLAIKGPSQGGTVLPSS